MGAISTLPPLAHWVATNLREPKSAAKELAAFRALEQQRPDIVLLDLMLPAVDDRLVLQQFAKNPLISDVPVIVVTA